VVEVVQFEIIISGRLLFFVAVAPAKRESRQAGSRLARSDHVTIILLSEWFQ
jgi:hypothetical protein